MDIRFAAATALCLAPALAFAQEGCSNAAAYSPCEVVFELAENDAAAHPAPYTTVDLRIEFRSPRRRTLAMPAYWDGGRRLVVRFSPTESGQWDYHVTSNIAAWNDKTGSFPVAASDSKGFIRTANKHHWAYTEKVDGLDVPHFWAGANEPQFATMPDAAFRSTVDTRDAQKFTHVRGTVAGTGSIPDLAHFQRVDNRVRYLNQKGLIADLVLAANPEAIALAFPRTDDRRRFVRFLVARYAAFHITWQGVEQFEDSADGRMLLSEIGGYLKQLDPYQHPRTSGARITSTPLIDDGWMDFATHGSSDPQVGSVEHQLYGVPFVSVNLGAGENDAAAFRKQLWNATMNGQYVSAATPQSSEANRAVGIWSDFLTRTR